jgi:transcriptional regulator with XRE-family HTH domain
MDQVKIGKFISDERKAKGYTQKQLSGLLTRLKCSYATGN